MKEIKIFLIFIFLIITIFFACAEKKRIALMELKPINIDETTNESVYELLLNELISSSFFQVLERKNIDEVIKELALSQQDDFDESTAKELGKLMGAEILAFGSISKLENQITLTLRGVNAETGIIEFSKKVNIKNITDLQKGINQLINSITNKPVIEAELVEEDLEFALNFKFIDNFIGIRMDQNINDVITIADKKKLTYYNDYNEIIIVGTPTERKDIECTVIQKKGNKILGIAVIFDKLFPNDYRLKILNISLKNIFGDKFILGKNTFEGNVETDNFKVEILSLKGKDSRIALLIQNKKVKTDFKKFINNFVEKDFYYKKITLKKGFDITLNHEIIVSNQVQGTSLYFSTMFNLNSLHSLGFMNNYGLYLRTPTIEDSSYYLDPYLLVGLKYRLSSIHSFFSLIVEPNVSILFQLTDNRLNKYILMPGISIGYEISYKYFSHALFLYLGTFRDLWRNVDLSDGKTDVLVIGLGIRYGFHFIKKLQ